jgi:hypothetical protein
MQSGLSQKITKRGVCPMACPAFWRLLALPESRGAPKVTCSINALGRTLPLRSKLTVQAGFVHPSRLLAAGPTGRQLQALLDHADWD